MKITYTAIPGVLVVECSAKIDDRGAFSRLYCAHELSGIIGARQIVQINLSQTKSIGAIRGMHFQRPPHAEMKLVSCFNGRVWDVAVDLRANSPTFLKWHAEELSRRNKRMLVIPEGCAHGFQVLEADSELLYLHTEFYTPSAEDGIMHNDPVLDIQWPLAVVDLSERDKRHKLISSDFAGIEL